MMAGEIQSNVIDQLSDTVRSLQKSLECTICLHLMTEPTKTRCGHSFCKACIGKVLRKKNASCPLCKKNLNRRNVSKDDHLEACITKLTNLITAIQLDSNVNILMHSKPRDTRESYISEIRDHSLPDENDNAIYGDSDVKVRTWLHHLPDDIILIESNANLTSDNANKLDATNKILDNKDDKNNRSRLRKQNIDYIDEAASTSRGSRESMRGKQFGKAGNADFSHVRDELKYKTIHAKVRTRSCKEDALKSLSIVKKTNNRSDSSLTTVNDQTCQILTINDPASTSTSAAQSSSADWTRMIEFGKETKRGRKRKMKKLNVNTEKNKDLPRVIENIALPPSKKYDLAKIAIDHNMSTKEKDSREQDAIEKNLNLSNEKVMYYEKVIEVSNEADTLNRKECTEDKLNNSTLSSTNHSLSDTSYVEKEKQVVTRNLSSSQVNEIIGFKNINKNSRVSQNQDEKSADIIVEYCNSPKKLTVLTPEKLNESVHEIISDIVRTPANKFRNTLPTENRTPELERNNSTQWTLGEVAFCQSPRSSTSKARLSLKRKLEIGNDRKTDSPLLSQVPLIDRLSINEKDVDDCKNVNSPVLKDGKPFSQLTTIRRDLNLETINKDQRQINWDTILNNALSKKTMNENVSRIIRQDEELVSRPTTSKRSKNIKNRESSVTFFQKGTMIKRRNVKYFYLGAVKHEQSFPAQVQITSVYNMQQSISKSEMKHIANMSFNLASHLISPDRSNEPQDTMDILMMENIHSVSRDVSKNAKVSTAASLQHKDSATSTPRKDIDHHLNREKPATIKENAQSLHKTPRTNSSAIKEISHVHSGTSNSIKLLSPDKDSQLKFLAIDSPMSEIYSRRAKSMRQQSELEKSVHAKENNFSRVKDSHFAASTSKTEEPSVENPDKRRRMIYTSDKELFDDRKNYFNDSASDNGRHRIQLDRYNISSKNAESGLDTSKKHRSNYPDNQDVVEIISPDFEEQDPRTRKSKRLLPISSSDTESESAEHVARNWKRPRSDNQSDQRNASITDMPEKKCLSIKHPSEKELSSRSERPKSLPKQESDMFESSSMFNLENVDYILQQSSQSHNRSKISEKTAEASNDDIINKVLQINRLQVNTNTCRPLNSAASQNNRTSQREKNSKEYLLQDNFDEIIANVELPQSCEDIIPCSDQPISSNLKSRPLAKQRTSNCLAMTDERGGAAQETPMLSASSTNDIFDHYSSKNAKRLTTTATLENLGKENVFHGQKKHDCSVDEREKKSVTTDADMIEIDSCRRISKHNVSHERERFSGKFSPPARRINVSIQSTSRAHDDGTMQRSTVADNESNLTTDTDFDSLLNVTQHQAQLQKFEEELLGIPQNRKGTTKKDCGLPIQEKQHTPKKQKKDTQDKEAKEEALFADEDDVVEKTPESKMKSNGNNVKLLESRRNISYLSPISKPHLSPAEQISKKRTESKNDTSSPVNLLKIYPLYQSTPQSFTTNKLKQPDERKLCFVCSGLTTSQLATVKEFAKKHDANYLNQFESDVTHVIMNTMGRRNVAKSTLKFLQGIAHRKWIVSYRWIEDCNEQGKLLDETPYEATTFSDNETNIDDGPRRSRLRKKNLFEGFTFLCIGPYINVLPNQYKSLLLATGATVVDSLEDLAKREGMKGIVIQDGVHNDSEIEHWYQTAKAAPIFDGWIVECISNYKLANLPSHYLSLQDLCAIGFPRELIADEECSDDEE